MVLGCPSLFSEAEPHFPSRFRASARPTLPINWSPAMQHRERPRRLLVPPLPASLSRLHHMTAEGPCFATFDEGLSMKGLRWLLNAEDMEGEAGQTHRMIRLQVWKSTNSTFRVPLARQPLRFANGIKSSSIACVCSRIRYIRASSSLKVEWKPDMKPVSSLAWSKCLARAREKEAVHGESHSKRKSPPKVAALDSGTRTFRWGEKDPPPTCLLNLQSSGLIQAASTTPNTRQHDSQRTRASTMVSKTASTSRHKSRNDNDQRTTSKPIQNARPAA